MASDICFFSATKIARQIQTREISAREVMEAHLAQIERVNPQVNAIVTLLPELAIPVLRDIASALIVCHI